MSIAMRLNQILCSLGGGDNELLEQCPSTERRRFKFSAMSNIHTSIISGVAMGFTSIFINKNIHPCIIFCLSLFWMSFCILINAALVGSVSKKNGTGSFFTTVGSLFLRVVISVIISLGTSQVMQILIFRDFFPYAHRKQQIMASQSLQEMTSSKFQEQEILKARLDAVDEEIQTWHVERSAVFTSDPILSDHVQQRDSLVSRLDSMTTQYMALNRISAERISSAQRSIAAITKELNELNELNNLGSEDVLRQRELNAQRASFNAAIAHETNERTRRNTEINNLERQISAQQENIEQRRYQIDGDNRERTRELGIKREMAAVALANAETENAAYVAANEMASYETFSQDSLINSLNTLRFIESWKADPASSFQEQETAKRIIQIRLLIMAIFLITDLAPLIIILFYKKGIYEFLRENQADCREAICSMEKQQTISEKKLEIQANGRLNKMRLESQIALNEIESFTQQSEKFYALLAEAREKAMDRIYDTHRTKFKNPLEHELADTADIIQEVFRNTQSMSTKMFDSMQTNDHLNFIRKSSSDKFSEKKTEAPYSILHPTA
jgi:hypothetical protein